MDKISAHSGNAGLTSISSAVGALTTDLVQPILGMDFFQIGEGKRYVIDPKRRCLVDRTTGEEFGADSAVKSISSVAIVDDDCYEHLWSEFPEVVDPNLCGVVTMATPLHISIEGPPVLSPCRKLHGDKKTQVEAELLH